MRLGTKILLLMLLITIGSSAVVAWIVTLNVTAYETRRANEQISLAIKRYITHLDERHHQIERIVRALMEAPVQRSQLQAADESSDPAAREQLKQEVLGRNVQTELISREGAPSFHVLLNQANDVVVTVAPANPALEKVLASDKLHWPVQSVLNMQDRLVSHYVSTSQGLFLAMGIALRTQLNEAPTHAYFVGFRVDDDWARRQLLSERMGAESTDAPLCAFFRIDDQIVARASSDLSDSRIAAFSANTPLQHRTATGSFAGAMAEPVEFLAANEHFLGQSFDLHPAAASAGHLILASSLDQALLPLHRLQSQIVITAAIAAILAVLACRVIARMISRPIVELVAGTQRIAAGQFDSPVQIHRRDELGTLADSFNQMAQGLKERDLLRDERVKIARDLAVARKIQMDILPKSLPSCPGYSLAACSFPAEATGGDIYDVVALALDPEGNTDPPSLVLLLADATGHGLGPAISVTQVRSMLRIGVRLRAGLDEVFAQINRQLCQDLDSQRFVTAFLGLLDPNAHRVNYHSAGQGPLIHFHAANNTIEWLDSSMVPLGLFEDARDEGVLSMHIQPGDLIVLLTDGFYEFQANNGDQFGKERIAAIIQTHHQKPAKEILHELLEATRAFASGAPQLDDMTALIIQRLMQEKE